MKTKRITVSITLELPADYKWLACQPYGNWLAFKRKPKVYVAWEDREQDGFVPKFWGIQKDELDLSDHGPVSSDREIARQLWRKTLRRIKR